MRGFIKVFQLRFIISCKLKTFLFQAVFLKINRLTCIIYKIPASCIIKFPKLPSTANGWCTNADSCILGLECQHRTPQPPQWTSRSRLVIAAVPLARRGAMGALEALQLTEHICSTAYPPAARCNESCAASRAALMQRKQNARTVPRHSGNRQVPLVLRGRNWSYSTVYYE